MVIRGKETNTYPKTTATNRTNLLYRSLRICLNLFSYYAPQIKEKHIKWYAVRLLQCMTTISQRRETLLQETLCDFVKHFGRYIQQGLSDSESCKLFEVGSLPFVVFL